MSARELETFLTRIYVDAAMRKAFKENPHFEALRAGLSEEECRALEHMDWAGLELAARSYAHKRDGQAKLTRIHSVRFRLQKIFAALSNTLRSR